MQRIKISSKVDALTAETHQNVSALLTEAIRDDVQGNRLRPVTLKHLEQSMTENEALGKLLAK